ncbi:MAG: hypothetical protein K2I99_07585 [Bacteroidaceae bacterium]|nr:hypothetical protein [Bacteroidaceae bacterium]
MKKYIFAVAALICCTVFSVTASNIQVTSNSTYTAQSKSRSVTVYRIVVSGNFAAKSSFSGTFDEENMTVSFKKTTERVSRNTDTGHGRENYTYKAGTCYYFN